MQSWCPSFLLKIAWVKPWLPFLTCLVVRQNFFEVNRNSPPDCLLITVFWVRNSPGQTSLKGLLFHLDDFFYHWCSGSWVTAPTGTDNLLARSRTCRASKQNNQIPCSQPSPRILGDTLQTGASASFSQFTHIPCLGFASVQQSDPTHYKVVVSWLLCTFLYASVQDICPQIWLQLVINLWPKCSGIKYAHELSFAQTWWESMITTEVQ